MACLSQGLVYLRASSSQMYARALCVAHRDTAAPWYCTHVHIHVHIYHPPTHPPTLALHDASAEGQTDVINVLLGYNANVDTENDEGA